MNSGKVEKFWGKSRNFGKIPGNSMELSGVLYAASMWWILGGKFSVTFPQEK